MMTVHLRKLHATGNDFLVLVDLDQQYGPAGASTLDAATVAALCDRSVGVGADGLLRLLPGTGGTDCTMELRNADGGYAEMSGNGIRCLVWAADQAGAGAGDRFTVATAAGVRTIDVTRDGAGAISSAGVDMGPATFDPAAIPVDAESPFDLVFTVDHDTYTGDAAGMGNPHVVFVVPDVGAVALERIGPVIEHDRRFPHRTNLEIVAVDDKGLSLRVWERGVGITRSCGTGVCAAAAVAHRRGLVRRNVTVTVPGGVLEVVVAADGIHLSGPVAHVFDSDVDLDTIRRSAGLMGAPT